MRVFVAGATGFLGRATCRALVAAGHHVVGLARDEAKAGALEQQGVRAIVGTLDDPATFLAQADRRVQLAQDADRAEGDAVDQEVRRGQVQLLAQLVRGGARVGDAGRLGADPGAGERELLGLVVKCAMRSASVSASRVLPQCSLGPHRSAAAKRPTRKTPLVPCEDLGSPR